MELYTVKQHHWPYTKTATWHFGKMGVYCFSQFRHSRIEVLQIAKVFAEADTHDSRPECLRAKNKTSFSPWYYWYCSRPCSSARYYPLLLWNRWYLDIGGKWAVARQLEHWVSLQHSSLLLEALCNIQILLLLFKPVHFTNGAFWFLSRFNCNL